MKCKIIFIISLLFTFISHASMIRAPQTPVEEFDAFLQTEKIESYAQVQLEEIQNQYQDIKNLSSLLEQAQRSFIKGHLKQAGDYFKAIVGQAYEKDWIKDAKNIIFYSYLRLAQIEWKDNPNPFLHSALVFAPSIKPDSSLFPPPLIQRFNEIKQNFSKLTTPLNRIFPFHDIILINGIIFPKTRISLPYGKHRVTALSASHQPWSQVVAVEELIQKRIVTPPWVSGTCKHPVVSKNIERKNILYPHFCRWKSSKKSPVKKTQAEELITNVEKNIEQGLNANLKIPKQWVWAGVIATGIVIGVWILSNEDQKPAPTPRKPTPTIRKGFPRK